MPYFNIFKNLRDISVSEQPQYEFCLSFPLLSTHQSLLWLIGITDLCMMSSMKKVSNATSPAVNYS